MSNSLWSGSVVSENSENGGISEWEEMRQSQGTVLVYCRDCQDFPSTYAWLSSWIANKGKPIITPCWMMKEGRERETTTNESHKIQPSPLLEYQNSHPFLFTSATKRKGTEKFLFTPTRSNDLFIYTYTTTTNDCHATLFSWLRFFCEDQNGCYKEKKAKMTKWRNSI